MADTRVRGSGHIDIKSLAKITDIPRGAGAKGIQAYKKGLARACQAAGPIAKAVWLKDKKLLNKIKPSTSIPDMYDLDVLKLAGVMGSAGNIYPKPDDATEALVYYQWKG